MGIKPEYLYGDRSPVEYRRTIAKSLLAPGIAFEITTVCNVSWNSLVASVRQETVPSNNLGRVQSWLCFYFN
jgi:hypothetical protein